MDGNATSGGGVPPCLQVAPNGYTCMDGKWGAVPVIIVIILTVAVAIMLLCDKDHRRMCGRGKPHQRIQDHFVGASNLSDSKSERLQNIEYIRQWLLRRSVLEFFRILSTVLILHKIIGVFGADGCGVGGGGNERSLSWHLVLLPSYIVDVLVVNLLVRQRSSGQLNDLLARLRHRMLRAYCVIAGFPLGTSFKISLGFYLESGSSVAASIAVALAAAAVGSALMALAWRALMEVDNNQDPEGCRTRCCSGQQRMDGSNAVPAVSRRRPWPVGIPLLVATVYLACASVMLFRVLYHNADVLRLGADDHDYTSGFFSAFSDSSWVDALLPVWAALGGAVTAVVGDVVFARLLPPPSAARSIFSVSFQRQLHLVDIFPLVGVLCFGVLFARALDTRGVSDFATAPLACHVYVPLVVAEALALFNILSLVVAFKSRCGRLLAGPPRPHTGTGAGTGVVQDEDHGQRASDTSLRTVGDSRIHLRESNQLSLEESMFENPNRTAPTPAGAQRHGSRGNKRESKATAYGQPYIDNPTFTAAQHGASDGPAAVVDDGGPAEPPHVLFTPVARSNNPLLPGACNPLEAETLGADQAQTLVRPHPPHATDAGGTHPRGCLVPDLHHRVDLHDVVLDSDSDAASVLGIRTLSSGGDTMDDGFGDAPYPNEVRGVEFSEDAFEDAVVVAGVQRRTPPTDPAAAVRVSVASIGRISIASGDTVAFDTTENVAGTVLDEHSVRIGMCVYVDVRLADPKAALFGDTRGCDGMVGVVQQADATASCQVHLVDGRQQWVQCRALIHVEHPDALLHPESVGSMASIGSEMTSLHELSTVLTSLQGGGQLDEIHTLLSHADCADTVRRLVNTLPFGEINTYLVIGKPLLHHAAELGRLDMVLLLLNAPGADPDAADVDGNVALHAALRATQRDDGAAIAAALIDAGGAVNHQNSSGEAPLHVAAQRDHHVAAEVFVAMGCHVDPRTRDTNETPLFGAIKSRSMRIVRLLTEQGGCNVNASDGDGDTPLHLAVSMATHTDPTCFIDIARYLVRHGANALIKNQHGHVALDLCPPAYVDEIKGMFVSAQVEVLLDNSGGRAPIRVGNRVRLKPSVERPRHGMQGISHRDVLVVREVVQDEVAVTFVDPDIRLRYLRSEMYRVFDSSGVVVTASSQPDMAENVFDPDRGSFWQSDGERGQHWLAFAFPHVGELVACEIDVPQCGVAYIPKRVEVYAGPSSDTLTLVATTDVVKYGWTALVPTTNVHEGVGAVQILVRSCHESGINCRVSGVRMLYRFQQTTIAVPSTLGSFTPAVWEDVAVGKETGTVLKGRYRLGRKVAQGGFGVTYIATDEDCFDEQVLIKFLHRLPGLELFRREARRLLDINHAQVPRLKAYFELKEDTGETTTGTSPASSKFALVMEMIHGRNLVEVLDDEGVWDEAATHAMLMSVLDVLIHVHSKGIVHRDIKAANIMRRDRDGVFFVIDFGACTTATATGRDDSHRIIGTPGYMAPETYHGKSCCESDLFSLGALALFMLKGVEPYRLQDKGSPDQPYSAVLDDLRDSHTVGTQTYALLSALLQTKPEARRTALDQHLLQYR
eukprot:m.1020733 g.1020733  ORF g.1020733 m.1020733 type:complete len:1577 (+) comp24090_c0_seq1:134-4864(+)